MAKNNFFVQFWTKNFASSRMANCGSGLPAEWPFRSQNAIEASDSPLPGGLWVKRLITHALCSLAYSDVAWCKLFLIFTMKCLFWVFLPSKHHIAVREITKSSSTFSATNTSSNIVWSISTAWHNPNEIKWNLILVPNLVAFISQKEKNVCFFDYHSLTCSVRKMVLICLMQNIDMYLLYKSHQIARLVLHLINHFSKWMFTVYQENATKFGTKNEISHIFLYH